MADPTAVILGPRGGGGRGKPPPQSKKVKKLWATFGQWRVAKATCSKRSAKGLRIFQRFVNSSNCPVVYDIAVVSVAAAARMWAELIKKRANTACAGAASSTEAATKRRCKAHAKTLVAKHTL